jgi:hypothetical protein
VKNEVGLERDLKVLYGIPPYDGPENTSRGDNYFKADIERRYGDKIENLKKKIRL